MASLFVVFLLLLFHFGREGGRSRLRRGRYERVIVVGIVVVALARSNLDIIQG